MPLNLRFCRLALLLIALSCLPGRPVAADDAQPLPPPHWSRQPVLAIPPARPAPPQIDGQVRYQEWFYATSIGGFHDAETGDLPPYPVQMLLCYDDEALYVGLVVYRHPMHPTPKASFAAGRHEHIWWKDDNVEVVLEPGDAAAGLQYGYVFVGNSVGGYAEMRYPLSAASASGAWQGQWQYQATRAGREHWQAELKIPFAQFGVQPPKPGDTWKLAVLAEQITPRKQLFDLSHMWSFGQSSYRSANKAQIVFLDENGPIFRTSDVGPLRPTERQSAQKLKTMGSRTVLYHQGSQPYTLDCRVDLYGADQPRPDAAVGFLDMWDRVLEVRRTGQPLRDPADPTQAFRSEADLLSELNQRYRHLQTLSTQRSVQPGEAGYVAMERPIENGEYVVAYRFTDPASGRVLHSRVVPFAVRPQFQLALTPFLLTHQKLQVDVKLTEAPPGAQAIHFDLLPGDGSAALDQATQPISAVDLSGESRVYLQTDRWKPDTSAKVVARIVDAQGQTLQTAEASLHRPPTPAWFGLKLGEEAVVPPPFEPVRLPDAQTASVWARRYRMGDQGLPSSILSRDEELLAAPIRLQINSDGGELSSPAAVQGQLDPSGRQAVFTAQRQSDDLSLQTTSTVYYDGAMRFDVVVTPKQPTLVRQMLLEIPIRPQWAALVTHAATSTDFARSNTQGLGGALERWFKAYPAGAMPFTYALFLGGYDRGLQWFCPSDRGWSNEHEQRKIALVRRDDAVLLQVRFIDRATTLREPLRLNFGLTVTPLKPTMRGREPQKFAFGKPSELRRLGLGWFDENMPMLKQRGGGIMSTYLSEGNHHFGQPWIYDPQDAEFLRDLASILAKHQVHYIPYGGWGVHTNIPEFHSYGKEMLKQPLRNAGWGCYWLNPASTFVDWWLAGARSLVRDTGFTGVYLDGTALPELAANELDGFAWTDAEGKPRGTYPVWEIRRFMERLYVMLQQQRHGDAVIDLHDGREPLFFVTSFTTSTIAGEYHLNRGKTVLEVFDPAEFAAYYLTHPHGDMRRFIWYNWMRLPISENQMYAMMLLHDVPHNIGGGVLQLYGTHLGYGEKTQPWTRLALLRKHYADSEFVGYWKSPALVEADAQGLHASAWVDRRQRRAMVVVSNLSTQPWQGTLRFNHEALGVDGAAAVCDAMFDLPLNASAQTPLTLSIEPQRYRLFLFNDRLPPLDPAVKDGSEAALPK